MKIIGFNYTKVSAERVAKWQPIKNINTNIQFVDIVKDEVEAMKDLEVIRLSFKFDVHYEPKNATISLEGLLFLNLDPNESKEVIKQWSKKKEVAESLRNNVVKFLWKKCNLKAFQLEEELNIPTHLQLPQISFKAQQ